MNMIFYHKFPISRFVVNAINFIAIQTWMYAKCQRLIVVLIVVNVQKRLDVMNVV